MKVVGLIGNMCTGKDTVARYLAERWPFTIVSIGDLVRQIAVKEKCSLDRSSLHQISRRLIREKGAEYLGRLVLSTIRKEKCEQVIISGIRTTADIQVFRQAFGSSLFLVHIDVSSVPLWERFQWAAHRNTERDPKAFHEFVEHLREEEEIFALSKSTSLADVIVRNDSTLEKLHRRVESTIWVFIEAEPDLRFTNPSFVG